MLIVGELINASRKAISQAIQDKDEGAIADVTQSQFEAGAHYIDVNAGVFGDQEVKYLQWLVQVVQKTVSVSCCLDSSNPAAIEAALEVHQGIPMINSISLEKERWDKLIPVLAGTDHKVVALCMSDEGMPDTADQRLSIADKLIEGLNKNKVPLNNIFIDPLVQSVATNSSSGVEFLKAVERIMTGWPGVHTICGLSNVSYGLPGRKFMNQTFMTMAIAKGLDGAIINPMDRKMISSIITAEALSGYDDFCKNYLKAYRTKKLEL